MDSFTISELAQFSGIKPHTIRIWEKRYQALKPDRSPGNTRHYDNAQLKRLLNISGLIEAGYKVSELCFMPDEKLKALHAKMLQAESPAPTEYFVSQIIAAAVTYNEAQFIHVFSHCLLKFGMKGAYLHVLYPALVRIGLMWLDDSLPTPNEYFVSNLIRQKLFTAIDSLPAPKAGSPTWVLFLPENEFHEIGLLLAYYQIRLSGQKVIYLGANVPLLSLRTALKELKPAYLLLFFVHRDLPGNTRLYLEKLNKDLPVKKVYVAANETLANEVKTGKKQHLLKSVEELDQQLLNLIV